MRESRRVNFSQDHGEELSRRFYLWEARGKGRALHSFPVELEPPFEPYRYASVPAEVLDDSRRYTVLSWFADLILGKLPIALPPEASAPPEPKPDRERELSELRLFLPRELRINREKAEGFLRALVLDAPIAWEFSAHEGKIRYGVALSERDRVALDAAARAFLPGVALAEGEPLSRLWSREGDSRVLEFSLSREFMVPLGLPLDPDPLLPLLSLFSGLGSGESAVLQILFTRARQPWGDSIRRSVRTPGGEPFFSNAPEVTRLADEKVAAPLFAASIRLALKAPSRGRLAELTRLSSGILQSLGKDNHLLSLSDNPQSEEDFLSRRTRRTGMLLSLSELAAFVRLPSSDLQVRGIERGTRKEKAPPPEALSGEVHLGEVSHKGERTKVFLPSDARLRHTHCVGATGTGKTTLLLNLILEDIRARRGVGVVDPHGDLALAILSRIPEERLADLHFLDPSDPEISTGWNALDARSEREREVLSSDLVSLFRRYSSSWGDQMSTALGNAVAALLSLPGSYTIADLRRFLVDRKWRDSLLYRISDPEIRFFWEMEIRHIGEKSFGSILARLNTFLRSRPIRESVSREKGIQFRELLDSGGILIARLPLGTLGEENTAVLGSLLVSKIHQAALGRADMRPEDRRPFQLYLDELHLFATPSLSLLLSGARKFGLGLTLAHQSLGALHSRFPEIEESLLANSFSRFIFRVGEEDARKLERGLSTFEAEDLLSLRTGEAVCRLGVKENDFLVSIPEPPSLSKEEEASALERVRAHLRKSAPELPEREEAIPLTPPQAIPAAPDPPPERREPRKRSFEPPPPAPLGRGGAEHQYLQALVAQYGEANGFRVTLEMPVLDGTGKVDVALIREGWSLAVEISVTTAVDHEVGNIRKCLSAGFSEVAAVSVKPRFLSRLRNALAKAISEEDLMRVHFFTPEELALFLESSPGPKEKVETVGGYQVKVSYSPSGETARRSKAVAGVIARSLQRMKGT